METKTTLTPDWHDDFVAKKAAAKRERAAAARAAKKVADTKQVAYSAMFVNARETATADLGLRLSFWSPRNGDRINGFLATKIRVYVADADGNDLGYVGLSRWTQSASGSYETHRQCKGQSAYNYKFESTVPAEVLAKIEAAVKNYLDLTGESFRLGDPDQFEYTFAALVN